MDSNVSINLKTTKKQGIEAHSRGRAKVPRWEQEE
jgi:hypothetical protein